MSIESRGDANCKEATVGVDAPASTPQTSNEAPVAGTTQPAEVKTSSSNQMKWAGQSRPSPERIRAAFERAVKTVEDAEYMDGVRAALGWACGEEGYEDPTE